MANSLQQQLANMSSAQGGASGADVSLPYTGTNLTLQQQLANTQAAQDSIPTSSIVSVPDRNLVSSSDTSGNSSFFSASSSSTSTQSTTSLSGSTQLPDGSGSQINTSGGVDASSGTGYTSSLNFNNTADIQNSTGSLQFSGSYDPATGQPIYTPDGAASVLGAASPITGADLQNSSTVFSNGFGTIGAVPTTINWNNPVSAIGKDKYDRVKLRFAPNHPFASYPANSILAPLANTNGLVWPFKPSVTIQSQVDYETMNLTHSIQEIHSFNSNKAPVINITGQFVCQSIDEALYAMAAIHFLRSTSKMSFGNPSLKSLSGLPSGTPAGAPPPVLLFSGYGPAMFNDLPVIINSYPLDLPTDVDYITIPFGPAAGTRLPLSFTISVSLTVQQSPQHMRNFDLNYFTQKMQPGWW